MTSSVFCSCPRQSLRHGSQHDELGRSAANRTWAFVVGGGGATRPVRRAGARLTHGLMPTADKHHVGVLLETHGAFTALYGVALLLRARDTPSVEAPLQPLKNAGAQVVQRQVVSVLLHILLERLQRALCLRHLGAVVARFQLGAIALLCEAALVGRVVAVVAERARRQRRHGVEVQGGEFRGGHGHDARLDSGVPVDGGDGDGGDNLHCGGHGEGGREVERRGEGVGLGVWN
jgi:hypothetical protein